MIQKNIQKTPSSSKGFVQKRFSTLTLARLQIPQVWYNLRHPRLLLVFPKVAVVVHHTTPHDPPRSGDNHNITTFCIPVAAATAQPGNGIMVVVVVVLAQGVRRRRRRRRVSLDVHHVRIIVVYDASRDDFLLRLRPTGNPE